MSEHRDLALAIEDLCKSGGETCEELRQLASEGSSTALLTEKKLRVVLGGIRRQVKVIRRQTEAPRARFAADHVCESLRGYRVPALPEAKRALVRLAKVLDARIAARRADGHPTNLEVEQLAAIVALAERVEQIDDQPTPSERALPLEIGK